MGYVEDRWKNPDGTNSKRHKKGRRWRVRYVDPAGRERSHSFDKKPAADLALAAVTADMARGNWVDPVAGRITLAEYSKGFIAAMAIEESSREQVERRFRNHILPTFGDMALAQIAQQPSAIQAWLQRLPLAPRSKNVVFAHLRSCLTAAVDDSRIVRNPCLARSITHEKPPQVKLVPWTQEMVDAVRGALPERYRAMCDAGAGLGMRQGEVLALSPGDIDWLRGEVHIRRQVKIVRGQMCFAPPKGDKERTVPLPESVKLRLSEHIARFPAVPVTLPWRAPGGKPTRAALIFTTTARRSINRSYLDGHLWKDALRKAGIEPDRKNGFHALRHYFASYLLQGSDEMPGEDIRTVAEYLGHTDPGFTLRIYAHFIPGREHRMKKLVDSRLLSADGPQSAQDAQEAGN